MTPRKENPVDSFIYNLIDRHLFEIVLFLLIAISVVVRVHLAPFCDQSPDYHDFYEVWVNYYKEKGFLAGLSHPIGDYYVPYNIMYAIVSLFPFEPWVMIAVFSCTAEYVGAFFIYKIVRFLLEKTELEGSGLDALTDPSRAAAIVAAATLYLPHAVFNSALWKQCDSIYICFMLISLYYLMKDKYMAAMIFIGISLSCKLQAVFLLPLFIIIYMAKKAFSIFQFAWLPVVFLIAGLPEVLLKYGLRATYFTYFTQMGEGTSEGYGMSVWLPNIYSFGLDDFYDELSRPAILFTMAVMVVTAFICVKYRGWLSHLNLMYLGIWLVWTCCMFLPSMHERYDYFAVTMYTVYTLVWNRKKWWTAVLLNICSLLTYTLVLFNTDVIGGLKGPAAIYIALYLYCTGDLFGKICGKKLISAEEE